MTLSKSLIVRSGTTKVACWTVVTDFDGESDIWARGRESRILRMEEGSQA